MKQNSLKNKITTNFSISAILVIIVSAGVYYRLYQEQSSKKMVNTIKSEIRHLERQQDELENKIIEIKKYREVFKKLNSKRKNTDGISFDNINSKLLSISEKYAIHDPDIKVSFPENLTTGIFNMDSIAMVSSSVTLSFKTISDVEALSFISEFLESLPGYTIIQDVSIRKMKDYTSTDLVAISSGKKVGHVSGNIKFYWYVYKQGRQESQ